MTGLKEFADMIRLLKEIYQHPGITPELKRFIELRMKQILGKMYDVHDYLNSKNDEPKEYQEPPREEP